jgi:hypothetical protein
MQMNTDKGIDNGNSKENLQFELLRFVEVRFIFVSIADGEWD